jgi:hypothetical protein
VLWATVARIWPAPRWLWRVSISAKCILVTGSLQECLRGYGV